MLEYGTYVEIAAAAIDAITAVGERDLISAVEHCPGFDVARLLEHTGGFCRIVEGRVARDEEWKPASGTWQEAATEVAGDPLSWHRTWGAALLDALRSANASEIVRTWAGTRTRYFWARRAAQELTVHRWDAEHAVGGTTPIDAVVALDGIDEFLGEFGKRAAPKLGGGGETYLFVADDVGAAYAVTTYADRFELHTADKPDVEARGSAEDVALFLWGRKAPRALAIRGDAPLLARWHERVRL